MNDVSRLKDKKLPAVVFLNYEDMFHQKLEICGLDQAMLLVDAI